MYRHVQIGAHLADHRSAGGGQRDNALKSKRRQDDSAPSSSVRPSHQRSSGLQAKFRDWRDGVTGRIQFAAKIRSLDDEEEARSRGRSVGDSVVFVEVEGCVDLQSAGPLPNRKISPFVVIGLNGSEVARTPALRETRNPRWVDECYEIPACGRCATLSFEAWDIGNAGLPTGNGNGRVGDFVGRATLRLDELRGNGANGNENEAEEEEIRDFDLELLRWRDKNEEEAAAAALCGCPEEPPRPAPAEEASAATTTAGVEGGGGGGTGKGAAVPLGAGSQSDLKSIASGDGAAATVAAAAAAAGSDASNVVHVRSTKRWTVRKRRGSMFVERPSAAGGAAGARYRVANPDPFRRRDIRDVADESGGGGVMSSTFCRAMCLIVTYLVCGILGYSFVFERWSIGDSLYFSVVTFTTVGYGDIKPVTDAGKLFSCVFALAGIGIIGIALGYIGQNLVQAQMAALHMAQNRNAKRSKEEDEDGSREGEDFEDEDREDDAESDRPDEAAQQPAHISAAKQLVASFFPILAMILLGSFVVGSYEGWNWVDSIYWCVITGTSVGYGDYVPRSRQMRWFSIVFIPLSVGVISAALGRIANIFVEKEIAKSNSRLLRREVTLEDLETMNADGDGEVSLLEFVEHMLKSMHKVDQRLLDELHDQFRRLDADGSGGLQQDDLEILTERKLTERRNMALEKYQESLLLRRGSLSPGGRIHPSIPNG